LKKFYDVEEIEGFEIYDSLGLFYGVVCGVEYRRDDVYVKACLKLVAEDSVPDTDYLKKALEEKGVRVGEETLDLLVILAREHGVDIRYRAVNRSISLVKGYIASSEIAVIDDYYESGRRKGVIVLCSPREARYRGRDLQQAKPPLNPDTVVGKLVVSLEKGLIGRVTGIVVGAGQPGIRVKRIGLSKGYIAWLRFLNSIKKRKPGIYEVLASLRDPLINRRISIEDYDLLVEEMRSRGVPEDVVREVDKYIESEESRGGIFADIPWEKVHVVNDIVISD